MATGGKSIDKRRLGWIVNAPTFGGRTMTSSEGTGPPIICCNFAILARVCCLISDDDGAGVGEGRVYGLGSVSEFIVSMVALEAIGCLFSTGFLTGDNGPLMG